MLVYHREPFIGMVIIYILALSSSICAKDFYASLEGMTKLLNTGQQLTRLLENIISEQTEKIEIAKK